MGTMQNDHVISQVTLKYFDVNMTFGYILEKPYLLLNWFGRLPN